MQRRRLPGVEVRGCGPTLCPFSAVPSGVRAFFGIFSEVRQAVWITSEHLTVPSDLAGGGVEVEQALRRWAQRAAHVAAIREGRERRREELAAVARVPQPRQHERSFLPAKHAEQSRHIHEVVAERCALLDVSHVGRTRGLQRVVQRIEPRAEDVVVHLLDELSRRHRRLVTVHRPAPSRVLAFVVVKAPHRGFAQHVPARAREGAACDAEHAGALEEEFRRLPARHRGALCTAVSSESQVKSTQL